MQEGRKRRRGLFATVRRNWKFGVGLLTLCAAIGVGTGIATQGLGTMMKRISLAFKAMDNPSQLTADEKAEVKSLLIKDKASAKQYYDNLTPEQQEQAKQQFNALSDEQKKKYRDSLGK